MQPHQQHQKAKPRRKAKSMHCMGRRASRNCHQQRPTSAPSCDLHCTHIGAHSGPLTSSRYCISCSSCPCRKHSALKNSTSFCSSRSVAPAAQQRSAPRWVAAPGFLRPESLPAALQLGSPRTEVDRLCLRPHRERTTAQESAAGRGCGSAVEAVAISCAGQTAGPASVQLLCYNEQSPTPRPCGPPTSSLLGAAAPP